MLDEKESAAGLEHAPDLGKASVGFVDRAENEREDDCIKGSVLERERLGAPFSSDDLGPVGWRERSNRLGYAEIQEMEGRDVGPIIEGQVRAGSSTDLEDDA